jgi:hypothetical protein
MRLAAGCGNVHGRGRVLLCGRRGQGSPQATSGASLPLTPPNARGKLPARFRSPACIRARRASCGSYLDSFSSLRLVLGLVAAKDGLLRAR